MSISDNFPISKPALSLNFAASRRLDPRISFFRSQATNYGSSYVDEDGIIRYADSNQPRFDHEVLVRRNLYYHSEDFSTLWSSDGITVSTNQIIAPDGTTTADKIVETAQTSQHLVHQSPFGGTGAVIGEVYTLSVYAKAAERTRIALTGHEEGYSVFDLSSGTVIATGNNITSMTPVGDGWFRCSATITKTNTNSAFYILIWTTTNDYQGVAGNGVFLWGAQVEQSPTMSSYIKTTTTQVSVSEYVSLGLLSEFQRTNLMGYSEQLRVHNSLDNVIFSDDEAMAPDGTYTASRLTSTISGGSNTCFIQKNSAVPVDTATYVFSVFLKKGTSPQTLINLQLAGGTYQQSTATINWTKNTISQSGGGTAYLWSYGNGWYRLAITLQNNGTNNAIAPRVYVRGQGTDNVSGENVFVWGWQVESSPFPSSYIPSTDSFSGRTSTATFVGDDGLIKTAASGVVRNNFTSTNLSFRPKLLLEPQSTNLLTYTEDFSNANWIKTNASITSNVANIAAPDGLPTSDKLVENTVDNTHEVYYTRTGSNETLTFSIFARAAERIRLTVQFSNFATADALAVFNLKSGVVDFIRETTSDYTRTRAYMIPYTNGWYRCVITTTKGSANTNNNVVIYTDTGQNQNVTGISYLGNGTSGVYIWGAQLEAQTYATSYIPATGASQVTRNADTSSSAQTTRNADYCDIRGSNLTNIYNPLEGTIVRTTRVDPRSLVNSVYETLQTGFFNPDPVVHAIYLRYVTSPTSEVGYSDSIVSGSVNGVDSIGTLATGAVPSQLKMAMTYKNNLSDLVYNGVWRETDTSVTLPTTNITRFIVIQGGFGTVSQISYYPERLSKIQLENLTK
jgi:hypothetical protein